MKLFPTLNETDLEGGGGDDVGDPDPDFCLAQAGCILVWLVILDFQKREYEWGL